MSSWLFTYFQTANEPDQQKHNPFRSCNGPLCYFYSHFKSEELKQKKGPGFWKFNQSRLHDENYMSLLCVELENFKQKYTDVEDLNLRWDLIKWRLDVLPWNISKTNLEKENPLKPFSRTALMICLKELKQIEITNIKFVKFKASDYA